MAYDAPDRMYEVVNWGVSVIVIHLVDNVLQKLQSIHLSLIGLEIGNITIDIRLDTHCRSIFMTD